MKKLLKFCALFLVSATLAHADLVIEQKMESSFMNGNMVMKVKGDRARMDVPSPVGQTTVLMDMKSGQMTTLVHAQKMAMKMDMSQAKAAAEAQQKATGVDFTKLAPKATGDKEKVGEWDCEIYSMDMGNGMSSKMWVAKSYPNYKSIMEQMNKINSAASAGMGMDPSKFDLGGMTVKTEVTTPLGKVVSTLVSAKEQAVDDSEFTVPAGYNEMKMPNLGGGK
jgi:hypothetical protein